MRWQEAIPGAFRKNLRILEREVRRLQKEIAQATTCGELRSDIVCLRNINKLLREMNDTMESQQRHTDKVNSELNQMREETKERPTLPKPATLRV